MRLISFFTDVDKLRNYKAPKGFQYLITSVYFDILFINVPTKLSIAVKYHNQEVSHNILNESDPIVTYGWEIDAGNNVSTTNPQGRQIVDINHTTKYLSIQVDIEGTFTLYVFVYGELIPISRTEAIIQWFGKGR